MKSATFVEVIMFWDFFINALTVRTLMYAVDVRSERVSALPENLICWFDSQIL